MFRGNPLGLGVRVFVWFVVFSAILGGSLFSIAGVLALCRGTPWLDAENLPLALLCAVIAWTFVIVFHFGKDTIHLPIPPQTKIFLNRAKRVLLELGYDIDDQADGTLETKGTFQLAFLCRGLRVQCVDRIAHISGPKLWVEIVRRRLRVQNFLAEAQQSNLELSRRGGGRLLQRVQIQMRVPPKDLQEIAQTVVSTLTREAEVVCEISLMAQSDKGIRDATIEQQLRPFLAEHGIQATIHKDLARLPDPADTMPMIPPDLFAPEPSKN